MNLINHIKNSHFAARLENIIGGRSINPNETPLRQTSIPNQQSALGEWTEIPDQYKTTLRIQHLGIDVTLYSEDFYGKRLTIFYNTANRPILRLDGALIETGNVALLEKSDLVLSVDHPYAAFDGTFADQSMRLDLPAGGSYLLLNGWAETSREMVEKHRKILKQKIFEGGDNTSEAVLGETLALIGYTWLAQASRADQIADQIANTFTVHHHWVGVCAQTASLWIDMPMRLGNVITRDGDFDRELAGFYSAAGHQSALERGVIEQMQPITAVSTVKLIDISNSKSDKIFDATSANFFSAVKPQLTNYDPGDLAKVGAYINAGYRLILPQDGALGENQWSGTGYIAVTSAEDLVFHIISGGLNGGLGTEEADADPEDAIHSTNQGNQSGENQIICSLPVDAVSGNQLYEHTDLTVGSSPYPIGLEFKRSYNSGMRLDDGPLGLGWMHNFHTAARVDSDGLQGMGEDSPVDAAAAIVEHYVANDILYGSKAIERVVIATIAHRWFMDQLIDNMVSVSEPDYTKRFLRLPDGSYNPPPGLADILTENADNSYLLRTKYGIELDFDTEGRLSTWKDTNNNTVTFVYSNGKLQTVSNNFNRILSFAYAGERISQVSDGTGRNISYAYNAAGNLTGFTDPNGNTSVFEYDIDGNLTKIFYPAHPAIPFVSITYDS
ncbi:MAG: hypothetical protein HKP52_05845, partial [Desulfofustis sp.]|nr:hypothetical protein [Desulfofustis sp.]